MAGDALSRLRTQALIFFSVTVPKRFDTKTREGRTRLAYAAAVVLLLVLAVVTLSDGGTDAAVDLRGPAGGAAGGARSNALFDGDDDDDDDDDEDGGGTAPAGGLEDEDEDDEDEDDEDGGGRGGGAQDSEAADDDGAADDAATLRSEQQMRQTEMKPDFTTFFEGYRHGTEIDTFIQSYVAKYSELGIIRSSVIGATHEKRQLTMYTIGKGSAARKSIVVVGSEHGCEWSVPIYLTYLITRLVQLYGINAEVTEVLDAVQIHVLPELNPDGASYTVNTKGHDARHYTKNRAPIRRHSSVKGVDLREDWPHASQLEVKAVHDYMQGLKAKNHLSAFVAVQCCGGAVHAPRNATCVLPEALSEQLEVGQAIARDMNIQHSYAFDHYAKPSRHAKVHSDSYAVHWAQNTLGLNLAYTLSAAPSAPEVSSKRKHSSSTKISDKKAIEVAEKDLITGSREITKGVVALGRHLAESTGRRRNVLCGAAVAPEPKAADEEEEEGDGEGGDSVSFNNEDDGEEDDGVSGDADEDEDEDGGNFAKGDADEDEDEDTGGFAREDDEEAGDEGDMDDHEIDHAADRATIADLHAAARGSHMDEDNSFRFAQGVAKGLRSSHSSHSSRSSSSHSSTLDDSAAAAAAKFSEGTHDVANALRFARTVDGVRAPVLQNLDQATLDGTGPYFLYFAYGPDMLFELLYNAGVTSAKKVVNAQLDGYGFDYTYYSRKAWKSGVADIYKRRGGHVLGVVYRVHRSQRAILDRHNLAASEESHVAPLDVAVFDKAGHVFNCVTYRVPSKMPGDDVFGKYKRFKPSRQYRNCVIKGAKQQHLPEDYIEKRLRSISALFSDKIGSTTHRNPSIGDLCDVHS